jgi:hypothetical protein
MFGYFVALKPICWTPEGFTQPASGLEGAAVPVGFDAPFFRHGQGSDSQ